MSKLIPFLALLGLLLFPLKCYLDGREFPVEGTYSGEKEPKPPKVSVNSVGRVHIKGPGTLDITGGTCFLLEHRLGTALVGAYHVLGNARSGSKITLVSKKPELATAHSQPLNVPHQGNADYGSSAEECRARGDLAGFMVDKKHEKAKVLPAATSPPKVGEPLWVIELQGAAKKPTGARAVEGRVFKHSNQVLVLKMVKATGVQWTSGAPIINQAGQVVGVNVGYFQDQHGYYRIAVPTESLRAMLR